MHAYNTTATFQLKINWMSATADQVHHIPEEHTHKHTHSQTQTDTHTRTLTEINRDIC